jgi:hypothetical protein
VDARARWIIGLLIALVLGLGVALIIVAGDDSEDSEPAVTAPNPATEKLTEPTTIAAPTTTTTPTGTTGGTPVPGATTKTAPDGQGGL